MNTSKIEPEWRSEAGQRHAFLKVVEMGLKSGLLGDGDKKDLLDIYRRLWPRAPFNIIAKSLEAT